MAASPVWDGKIRVVTKSDVGVGAPRVVGVFFHRFEADKVCTGAGRFHVHECQPGRAYRPGELLDVEVIEVMTMDSMSVDVAGPNLARKKIQR